MGFFEEICKDNPEIGTALKYVLLGKVFNLKIRDTGGEITSSRICSFCSNVSSSGKDQGRKALEIAINEINKREFLSQPIKFDRSVDVNDAALVGTKKIVKKEFVPVFGKFSIYDIMCFPECQTLFRKSEYKTTMVQLLQGALDQPGYVSKSLAGNVEIKYNTDTAIIMMSTPFKAMTSSLLECGFFQRFLIFIGNKNYIDIEDTSKSLGLEMVEGSNSISINHEKLNTFIDSVDRAYRLHNSRPNKPIRFIKGCMDKVRKYEKMFAMTRDREFISEEDKTLFATFQPRMEKMFIRMSAINSVYRLHEEVLPEDFDEPLEMMKWNIESVVKLIKMKTDRIKKEFNKDRIIKIIEGSNNVTEAYRRIAENEHVNMNRATEIYKKVMKNKIVDSE